MNEPNRPAKPTLSPPKIADRTGAVAAKGPGDVAEHSSPETRPTLGALSTEELNDLNSRLAPALRNASHFETLWVVWSTDGDHVAATAAGVAAAACRAAVQKIHAAWFAMRQMALLIEDVDRPFGSAGEAQDVHPRETTEQALDRLVTEIEEGDADAFATLQEMAQQSGERSAYERIKRLRECPEGSNRKGILYYHPPVACMALFRALLVSPLVYLDVRGDLVRLTRFRGEAITFKGEIETLERRLRARPVGDNAQAPPRLTLPGLTPQESEQFRDSLEAICAGDVRTRHGKRGAERISTVRLIADHFRRFANLSRTSAADQFRVAPWSSGIAALASAALNDKVTTEDVRGALKNWMSD